MRRYFYHVIDYSITRNTCYVLLVFMYLLHLIPQFTTSCAPAFFGIALHNVNVQSSTFLFCGPKRDRTDDLLNANQALSQLSYGPILSFGRLKLHSGGPEWT